MLPGALQGGLYVQAAHCYEELLLHSPSHIPFYVQYADIMYTLGSHYLKTARQYYAAAIEMSQGSNLRALYGLTACAAQMSGQKVGAGAANILRFASRASPLASPSLKRYLGRCRCAMALMMQAQLSLRQQPSSGFTRRRIPRCCPWSKPCWHHKGCRLDSSNTLLAQISENFQEVLGRWCVSHAVDKDCLLLVSKEGCIGWRQCAAQ